MQTKKSLGQRLAEEGMELVLENCGEQWREAAMKKLRRWCSRRVEPFAFEEFRAWALKRGLPAPHSPNAWGALAQAAARDRMMIRTRRLKPATSPLTHGHMVRLWRSGRSA